MTRFATPLVSLAVIFSVLSGGLAGPACSAKYRKTSDCVQRCKSKWGVPGRMMGSDRWGAVMQKTEDTKDAWDSIVSEACGMKAEKLSSGPILGPVKGASDSITTSTSSTPSVISTLSTASSSSSTTPAVTSSSSLVISSSSSKPAKSSSPPPTTSTTSTQKPPSTTPKAPPAETPKQETPKPPLAKALSGGGDIAQYLSTHNSVRAQHGASDLTWSDDLASKAQQWANNCKFEHSGGSLGPFGENLAAGTGNSYGISDAVKSWTDEVSDFNSNNPNPSHFTQVVWKGSTQLGCAIQSCDGIFDDKAKFIVCEYSPQGNIIGEFDKNVQA